MSEGIEHSLGPGENDLRASRSRSRSVQQNQARKARLRTLRRAQPWRNGEVTDVMAEISTVARRWHIW